MNYLGQRTALATSGTAFPNVPSWLWGYDSLGQVTSADTNVNTSDRSYQYDTIGNRLQSGAGVAPAAITNYTANALNQYSSISNPQSTILNPIHDADGNMTSGPLPVAPTANSVLTWDAENRLIETQVGTSGPLVRDYYDAQSRRIAETVGTDTTLYIYDAWNCIAEYTGPALAKTRLWGIDLSGGMQGAGGVGGIITESSLITSNPITFNTYVPTYDGNGNVSEYLDSTGSIVAHYEYDPFGNTVVATGPKANDFDYRFSTKPLSQTTGLYYYTYRWYDPLTGRWPSRDPIWERGGVNMYGFVFNNGTNRFDRLGLQSPSTPLPPRPTSQPKHDFSGGGFGPLTLPPSYEGYLRSAFKTELKSSPTITCCCNYVSESNMPRLPKERIDKGTPNSHIPRIVLSLPKPKDGGCNTLPSEITIRSIWAFNSSGELTRFLEIINGTIIQSEFNKEYYDMCNGKSQALTAHDLLMDKLLKELFEISDPVEPIWDPGDDGDEDYGTW